MFDQFGNPIAAPTFPAMAGYGGFGAPDTPFLDSLNTPASMLTPNFSSVTAPALGNVAVPNLPMLDSVNGSGGSMWDSFFNQTKNGITQQGWGGMALGAGSALMNGILGFKQLGIAKDTLAQNKRQFDINFGAQQKTTNARLADRQAARIAADPTGNYASVSDYMKQYGI